MIQTLVYIWIGIVLVGVLLISRKTYENDEILDSEEQDYAEIKEAPGVGANN